MSALCVYYIVSTVGQNQVHGYKSEQGCFYLWGECRTRWGGVGSLQIGLSPRKLMMTVTMEGGACYQWWRGLFCLRVMCGVAALRTIGP